MGEFTFGKHERLTKRPEFEQVMTRGRRKKIDHICTLFYLPNGMERGRLGIIASRKIGNAVVRNRSKRKIREVFRHIKFSIHPAMDIVVISGKGLLSLPVSVLEAKLAKYLPTNR